MSDAADHEIAARLAAGVRATLAGDPDAPANAGFARPAAVLLSAADAPTGARALTRAPAGAVLAVATIGGLVPPAAGEGGDRSVGAALEFAVRVAGVRNIVLIGRADSDFVGRLLADATPAAGAMLHGEFLSAWTALLAPAVQRALSARIDDALRPRVCAQEILRVSIENLMTYPWIVDPVLAGALSLHVWYVDPAARLFERLDPATDDFVAYEPAPLTDGK